MMTAIQGSGQGARAERTANAYVDIPRANARLESYYNGMEIVAEERRDEFWATMRRDLPSSFRFTGSKGHALLVQRKFIDHYIPELSNVVFEGKHIEPPKPLPWYPDSLGWSLDTPKQVVRKDKAFAAFQRFLVSETSIGNISRQEAVSMIPPLLMDLRPGM